MLFIACGEGVGIMLYSNAESGKMIVRSALILLPMSVTMISTSLLNSLGCERQTLFIFALGSFAMLLCVWFLPQFLGSGALLAGMSCDYFLCAACSLWLLRKKTGPLRSGKYALKLLTFVPVCVLGVVLRGLFMKVMSYIPALALTMLAVFGAEIAVMALFKLFDFRAFFAKFLPKKRLPAA